MHDRFALTKERMIARRQDAFDVMRHVFDADCVVITLGFTECFYDTARDLYVTNSIVQNDQLRADLADQIEFQSLTFAQSYDFIRRALDLIHDLNPAARILLTVSPVPLQATFTGQDVILATSQTKSLLRAVVGEIVGTDPRVGYFPGYEQVMLSRSWDVFTTDLRHVSDHMVKSVVSSLTQTYFETDTTLHAQFDDNLSATRSAETKFSALLEDAQSHIEGGNAEAARTQAELALTLAQSHPDITNGALKAWRILDQAAVQLQDWPGRDTALQSMAALRPGACMVWVKLAYNHLRLSDPVAAKAALQKAKDTAPADHPTVHDHIEKLTERLKPVRLNKL